MIYKFLKLLVRIAIRVFYKNLVVHKLVELPRDEAIIAVGNHPNTLMDPLIVASIFKQQVGFLGNASIFVNSMANSFLRYFHVIKVYRDKDVPKGSRMNNKDAFRESYKYLNDKNTLLIFPEGNSYQEMKLRKIKTGAARIALNTEKSNDYNVGVKIIPFGLNYSSPGSFRSKLYVNVGKPILVSEYIDEFKADEVKGVKNLTEAIRNSLEEVLITTNDDEHETLFLQLKQIYKRRLVGKFKRFDKSDEEYRLTKELSKSIQYFKIGKPESYQLIKGKIETYIQQMDELNLQGSYFNRISSKSRKLFIWFFGFLYTLIGLPIFIYGLIQNYIPYKIPYWVAKKGTSQIEYHAPIMMILGILIFPFYYFIMAYLFVSNISANNYYLTAYLISMPITGFYCLHYIDFFKNIKNFFKFNPVFNSLDERVESLIILKKEITEILDEARATYLKRL